MKKCLLCVCLFALMWMACDNKSKHVSGALHNANITKVDTADTVKGDIVEDSSSGRAEVVEHFTDSTNIGRKGKNKVELLRYRYADEDSVSVKFYSKKQNEWVLKNAFRLEKDQFAGCDMLVEDMTNDKLKDMTYVSAIAARGSNEVRTLFVYDAMGDSLTRIKNSEEYPNMLYNKGLNCIDAFMIHGGCTTVFARIEKDSLKTFASIDLSDNRIVKTYDRHGKATVIRKDTILEFEVTRYKNYRPLEEF